MGAIEAGMQLLNPCTINIESDHRGARAGERHRHGKPDIAQTNYRYIASWCQTIPLLVLVSGGMSPKSVSDL
jgi:hypothetical protein